MALWASAQPMQCQRAALEAARLGRMSKGQHPTPSYLRQAASCRPETTNALGNAALTHPYYTIVTLSGTASVQTYCNLSMLRNSSTRIVDKQRAQSQPAPVNMQTRSAMCCRMPVLCALNPALHLHFRHPDVGRGPENATVAWNVECPANAPSDL